MDGSGPTLELPTDTGRLGFRQDDSGIWATVLDAASQEIHLENLPSVVGRRAEIFDWAACLELIDQVVDRHRRKLRTGARVLELGCGLGLPSLVFAKLGADVVCTDLKEALGPARRNAAANGFPQHVFKVVGDKAINVQEEMGHVDLVERLSPGALVECLDIIGNYLHYRILVGEGPGTGWVKIKRHGCSPDLAEVDDRPTLNGVGGSLHVLEFKWNPNEMELLLERVGWDSLDLVVCSDCVYESAYSKSWLDLADCLEKACGLDAEVFVTVTRRKNDGVDDFIERVKNDCGNGILFKPLAASKYAAANAVSVMLRRESLGESFYSKLNVVGVDNRAHDEHRSDFDIEHWLVGRGHGPLDLVAGESLESAASDASPKSSTKVPKSKAKPKRRVSKQTVDAPKRGDSAQPSQSPKRESKNRSPVKVRSESTQQTELKSISQARQSSPKLK